MQGVFGMLMMRTAMMAVLLGVPMAASANCERDLQDLTPKVAQIKDKDTRQKADDYLQRAHRELDENDDFECQGAVDAAAKLVPKESEDKARSSAPKF